ncbi:MAG: prepilin-type cleavage/methylation domain-containing protein [Rhodocyclales bacterium]|nr:prepilin-type cleavage/methylation domain-containing protein [Rhodocyclales bacterium]
MKSLKQQAGVMLLEALIGVLIFSLGVLGLIGMQAVATKAAGEAKFRAEATMFADQLIGQMSADNIGNLEIEYEAPGGAKYLAWADEVMAAGTGLPGADLVGNRPIVVIDGNTVTITVRWQLPSEAAAHQYITVAQVNGS